MTLRERLGRWWKDPRRRLLRQARHELDALFTARRELLRRTSLRPEHRSRVQLLDVAEDPLRIRFTLLRHPRPYPFSRQSHEVVELWEYGVEAGTLERVAGHNLSRARGEDGDAPA